MQALDLVLSTFIEPGDAILTEELTYSGTLGIMRHLKANIVGIPMDYVGGMNVDALEARLKTLKAQGIRPKLIYTTANHQNPTAAILTLERRERMLELANAYDTLIIEDDCYGDIDFVPNPTPDALFKLDDSNRVISSQHFRRFWGRGYGRGILSRGNRTTTPFTKIVGTVEQARLQVHRRRILQEPPRRTFGCNECGSGREMPGCD